VTNKNLPAPTTADGDVEAIDDRSFQPIVALIGLVSVALGISGLVDDTGLLEHPWWVTLVVAGVAGCVLVILRTLQGLRSA